MLGRFSKYGFLAGAAIQQNPVMKGAAGGAALGAAYGTFSSDSSFFGGAMRGGLSGAMIGAGKGYTSMGAAVGAGMGGLFGDSALTGALVGAGVGYGARLGAHSRRVAANKGLGWSGAAGIAGRRAMRQGRVAASHLGRTSTRAVNGFQGLFS